jgi:hypothetical protein
MSGAVVDTHERIRAAPKRFLKQPDYLTGLGLGRNPYDCQKL